MQQKMRLILALAVSMFAISVAVFYFSAPRPAEIAQTAEVTQPARETPGQPGEKLPLPALLAMVASIGLAAWLISRIFRKRTALKPQHKLSGDAGDESSLPVPPGVIAQLQNITAEISSWTLDNDRRILEQLNRDARRIGEALYRQGGKERMLEVYRLAGSQRVIESAWDGIGTWKG